jgi:hypothetical protein
MPWIAPDSATILSIAAVMLSSSVTFAWMAPMRPGNLLIMTAYSSPGSANAAIPSGHLHKSVIMLVMLNRAGYLTHQQSLCRPMLIVV